MPATVPSETGRSMSLSMSGFNFDPDLDTSLPARSKSRNFGGDSVAPSDMFGDLDLELPRGTAASPAGLSLPRESDMASKPPTPDMVKKHTDDKVTPKKQTGTWYANGMKRITGKAKDVLENLAREMNMDQWEKEREEKMFGKGAAAGSKARANMGKPPLPPAAMETLDDDEKPMKHGNLIPDAPEPGAAAHDSRPFSGCAYPEREGGQLEGRDIGIRRPGDVARGMADTKGRFQAAHDVPEQGPMGRHTTFLRKSRLTHGGGIDHPPAPAAAAAAAAAPPARKARAGTPRPSPLLGRVTGGSAAASGPLAASSSAPPPFSPAESASRVSSSKASSSKAKTAASLMPPPSLPSAAHASSVANSTPGAGHCTDDDVSVVKAPIASDVESAAGTTSPQLPTGSEEASMTQQSSLPQQTPVMTQETELLGGETTPQEESQQPPPSMSSARPLQSQQMSQRQSQFVADTTVDRDALSPYAGLPTISTGHDLSTGAKDDSDDGSEASSVRPPPTLRGPSAYPASATQSGGARFTSSPAEGPTPSGVSFRSRRLASTAPPPSLDAAPWPYARSPSAGVDDSDDGVPTGATSTRDAVSVIGAMSQAVSRATAMTMMTQGTQQGGAQSEGTQPEGYVAAWLGDYGEPTPARPAKRARRCGPFSVAPQDWFTSAEAEAEFDRGHAEYVEEFNKYIAEYM